MAFTLSPNMSLPIPGVGTEAGPQYASDVNNSLTLLDSHTHAIGSGVQITPAAININADLGFNSFNIVGLRSARLVSQISPLAGVSDLGCIYQSGVDLYYNDGSGNQIRITQGGSVSGATGTITGLPSGTASASYASGTFVFQSATNTGANVDGGSFILRNNTVSSFGLTLQPPNAMATDYSLTLPPVPAQTNVMTLDISGNMGSITYDQVGQAMTFIGADAIAQTMTPTGANAIEVTRTMSIATNAPVGGLAITPSCGVFSTTSTSPVVPTNLTLSLVTSGRPVHIQLSGDGTTSSADISTGGSTQMLLKILRNSVTFYSTLIETNTGSLPSSIVSFVDMPTAGTNTYNVTIASSSGGTVQIRNSTLIAYEL